MRRIALIIITLIIAVALPLSASAAASEFPLQKGDSGDDVVRLQLRLLDLGYVSFRATGRYGDMTQTGITAFQGKSGLEKDGITGENVWDAVFNPGAPRADMNAKIKRVYGPGQTKPYKNYGQRVDWAQMNVPVGTEFKITDLNTSVEFNVVRTGGTNHCDIEPVDAAAFEGYKKIFGGGFSWEKRSVVAEINGERYAASLFGMPNANDKIADNGIEGSLCLYFAGCKSDIGSVTDVEHNTNIARAAGE